MTIHTIQNTINNYRLQIQGFKWLFNKPANYN